MGSAAGARLSLGDPDGCGVSSNALRVLAAFLHRGGLYLLHRDHWPGVGMVSAPGPGARDDGADSQGVGSRRATGGRGAGWLLDWGTWDCRRAGAEDSDWLREENKVDTAPASLLRIIVRSPSLRASGGGAGLRYFTQLCF
ncbi:hypothetical protein J1605_000453 [Eschrichtius robustus]|uniref:Uncharacterized protein n=1 Tax=Eschrichtius robustus TaxID=9764 RepID=A0AB34HAE9_ESCRO|nr:hypothetical protein J1605_000453 [Eschrichtius robustus]